MYTISYEQDDNDNTDKPSETYQFDYFGRTVGLLDEAGNGSQYSYNDATEDNKKKNNTG